jgi:serine O-acetyltransferase
MLQHRLVLCRPEAEVPPVVAEAWASIRIDAAALLGREPALSHLVGEAVMRHDCFASALGYRLAHLLAAPEVDATTLVNVIADAFAEDTGIVESAAVDLTAIRDRDPACPDLLTPLLWFKGFQAVQIHRVAHWLWAHGRIHLARHLQSRSAEVFAIDIHPAARLGRGILIDHGTGVVIGETSVVEDDVSILQEVTLGGTGKECGDRHPKIRRGVLIGAGAKILGNIEVGEGAKVGAGSIVLAAVAPYTTVAGVPARPVGRKHNDLPGLTMDQMLISPEYVI